MAFRTRLRQGLGANKNRILRLSQRYSGFAPWVRSVIVKSGLWDAEWVQSTSENLEKREDLLGHYLRWGNAIGICPSALFDTRYYLRTNPDVRKSGVNALLHYARYGHAEGRQPNLLFNDRWYREAYRDIPDDVLPLAHFLTQGFREGKNPHPLFHTTWYLEQNPDVAKAGINPLAHYLHFGLSEGRRPNPSFDPDRDDPYGSVAISGDEWMWAAHSADQGIEASMSTSDSPAARLDGARWHSMFGRLTGHERQLLARGIEGFGVGRVLVAYGEGADALTEASVYPGLVIEFTSGDGLHSDRAQDCDALVILDEGVQIDPDAIALGLARLHAGNADLVYFDALNEYSTGAEVSLFPDWSPALCSGGGLDPGALMLRPKWMTDTGQPDLKAIAVGRDSGSSSPVPDIEHVPFVGARIRREEPPRINRGADSDGDSSHDLPAVSIVIPTRNRADLLRKCIESVVEITCYPSYEFVIVDNGSDDPEAIEFLGELRKRQDIKIVKWNKPFNFSELINLGARHATGALLCLMNNDVEATDADWLQLLAEQALKDDCGAAGAMLLYPNGTIQQHGIILGPGGAAANRYAGRAPESLPWRHRELVHEVSAVTGACMVTRRDFFDEVGGLDQKGLSVAFNDVDYCLRQLKRGRPSRAVPAARLIHRESASLDSHEAGRSADFAAEVATMRERWSHWIDMDPYHNINLAHDRQFPDQCAPGNPRARLWRSWGIPQPEHPDMRKYHPPIRWYDENNQQRVHSVRSVGAPAIPVKSEQIEGLSILILTKDRPQFIVPLVKALERAVPELSRRNIAAKVFLGDTGSSDKIVLDVYRRLTPDFELVKGLKYHFSACNNLLLQRARSYRTTLFLNNDIEFENCADSLEAMYRRLNSNPHLGVLGAVLHFHDGKVQHEGVKVFQTAPLRGFVYHPNSRGKACDLKRTEARQCPAVTGALLMARTELLTAVGGFDEGYAAECQDADLCYAIHRLGHRVEVMNAGGIIHHENGTRQAGEENWSDRRRLMRRWFNYVSAHHLSP